MQKVVVDKDGWTMIVIEENEHGVIVDWRFVGGDEEPTRFIPHGEYQDVTVSNTVQKSSSLATWDVSITSASIAPTTHLHLKVEAKGSNIDLYVIPNDGGHIVSIPSLGISISVIDMTNEHYLYAKLIGANCNRIDAASVANALSIFAEYRERIQTSFQQ